MYYSLTASGITIQAFDWYRNRRHWMTCTV